MMSVSGAAVKGGGHGCGTPRPVPDRLLTCPWVGWLRVPTPGRAKPAKVPIDPRTGRPADVGDPATWADYPTAAAAVDRHRLDGIGVVLVGPNGLTGLDLDRCVDPAGTLDDWSAFVLDRLPGTYAEFSPSGSGVRAFVDGLPPPGTRNRSGRLECYWHRRFLTVTFDRLPGRPLEVTDAGGGLGWLAGHYLAPPPEPGAVPAGHGFDADDAGLIRRAAAQPGTGPRLAALLAGETLNHGSPSEADWELARLLGFWCGGDAGRVERIMRASGAARDKWDDHPTYLKRTVAKALSRLSRVYAAGRGRPSPPTPTCADKSVPHPGGGQNDADRLLAFVRSARLRLGRPVGLSSRQAAGVIGRPVRTAARVLARMVGAGTLVLASEGTYGTRRASEYDLPEYAPRPAPAEPVKRSGRPTAPPPYTRTPGGLLAIWRWSPRQGGWVHLGDCPDADAAGAVAGRFMARWPGFWSVAGEYRRYARGRALRIGRLVVGGAAP